MEKVRIGVIGAGNMGRNHIRILSLEKGPYEFVGFYDADQGRAAEIADQLSVTAFPRLEELLERVDAVTVAAPSSLHRELALAAARHRAHALVEKPLALTPEDAEEISRAFSEAGLILAVGHVERYNPVITELRKLIRHERIVALEARRYSPYDGRITDADVVQDLMVHDIDLACNVLIGGELPDVSSVGRSGASGRLDYVQSLLRFEDGTVASIGASRMTQSKVREIVVHTDRSYIVADLLNRSLLAQRNTNLVIGQGQESAYRQDSVTQKIFVPIVEPLRMELVDFMDHVLSGSEPAANGQTACRTMRVAGTIIRQAMGQPAPGGTR